jgi:hypothetical protein
MNTPAQAAERNHFAFFWCEDNCATGAIWQYTVAGAAGWFDSADARKKTSE